MHGGAMHLRMAGRHANAPWETACACTHGGRCFVGWVACTVASVVPVASVAVPAPAAAAEGNGMLARGGQQRDGRHSAASQACGRGRLISAWAVCSSVHTSSSSGSTGTGGRVDARARAAAAAVRATVLAAVTAVPACQATLRIAGRSSNSSVFYSPGGHR